MSQWVEVIGYDQVLADIVAILGQARITAARSVNTVMTTAYWRIGRRIVEQEQGGQQRAAYGQTLLERLSTDLTGQYGRGFSRQNLQQMRQFYLMWPAQEIRQTASGESGTNPLPVTTGADRDRRQRFGFRQCVLESATRSVVPWPGSGQRIGRSRRGTQSARGSRSSPRRKAPGT